MQQLLVLLRSPNTAAILSGLFIAEESLTKAAPILPEIVETTKHPDPQIRYAGYTTIASCFDERTSGDFHHVVKGVRDEDAACRKICTLWMMRVRETVFRAALEVIEGLQSEPDIARNLRWLLEDSAKDKEIEKRLANENDLDRRFGVVAAGRTIDAKPYLKEVVAQQAGEELKSCFGAQMRFLELVKKYGRKFELK